MEQPLLKTGDVSKLHNSKKEEKKPETITLQVTLG